MTGPEHYREAEACLGIAEGIQLVGGGAASCYLARAQVHATLALAAATAIIGNGEMAVPDSDAWVDAASAYKRPAPSEGQS
jgi:hypothetical protein